MAAITVTSLSHRTWGIPLIHLCASSCGCSWFYNRREPRFEQPHKWKTGVSEWVYFSLMWVCDNGARWLRLRVFMRRCFGWCCRRRRPQICLTCSPSPDTSTSRVHFLVASTARPTPTLPWRTSSGPRMTARSSSTDRPEPPPVTAAFACPDTARSCCDRQLQPTPDCIRARRTRGLAKDSRQLRYTFTSKVLPAHSFSFVALTKLLILEFSEI